MLSLTNWVYKEIGHRRNGFDYYPFAECIHFYTLTKGKVLDTSAFVFHSDRDTSVFSFSSLPTGDVFMYAH